MTKKRELQPTLKEILSELNGRYSATQIVELTGYSKAQVSKTCKKYGVPYTLENLGSYNYKIYDLTKWLQGEREEDKLI